MTRRQLIQGFTFIEILVFIIVSSILMSMILLSSVTSLRNAPLVHQQWLATQYARQCLEWYLGQRRQNGYATIVCPSTPTATACTLPAGFTATTSVTCTTWNSDTTYKTLTVQVSGRASASLTLQLGDY